jgi:hypothetical protein
MSVQNNKNVTDFQKWLAKVGQKFLRLGFIVRCWMVDSHISYATCYHEVSVTCTHNDGNTIRSALLAAVCLLFGQVVDGFARPCWHPHRPELRRDLRV